MCGEHLLPSHPPPIPPLRRVRVSSLLLFVYVLFSVVIAPSPVEILLSPSYTSRCLIFRPYPPSFSLPSSPPATDCRFPANRKRVRENQTTTKKACTQAPCLCSLPSFFCLKWIFLWLLNMDDLMDKAAASQCWPWYIINHYF